jgi:hypothetical protein
MEPLSGKICDETNEYARVQLNNPNRKKLKDDEKWFDTTHSFHRGGGKRSESAWQCKQCGFALHVEERFEVYDTQQSFKTPLLVSLDFQYYACKIPERNLY